MSEEPLSERDSLALTLYDIGAVQFGKFVLHSGKKSNFYLDLRVLVSYPDALRQVAKALAPLLGVLKYDLLAATPLAGLPIGTALCLEMNQPLIYPRKAAKSYGTGKGIEGIWRVGQSAVVIDDLVTSGDSILQTFAYLKASGIRVSDAVVLIDREQGGVEMLSENGYRLHSVLSVTYLFSVLQEHDRISPKQHTKALKSLRK